MPFTIYLTTFQEMCLKSFKEMAGIISRKSRDKAALTSVINDTAVIVETGLVHIIRASSDSARVYGEDAIKDNHLPADDTKQKVNTLEVCWLTKLTFYWGRRIYV